MNDLADRVEQMRQRAPKAHRQTTPDVEASPVLVYGQAADGIARAIEKAGTQWETDTTSELRRYLEANPVLHVDQFRPHMPDLPEGADGRALGAVIARAKSARWIEPLPVTIPGYTGPPIVAAVQSTKSRGGLKTLWRSNLYQGNPHK